MPEERSREIGQTDRALVSAPAALVAGHSPIPERPSGGPAGRAYLLLAITALSWGGNAVASRLAVGEISPMALTCLRWTIVMSISLAITHREITTEWTLLRRNWPLIFAMGAFGFTGFNALLYVGAHYTTAVNLTIIQGSVPVLVLLGALLVFKTRITVLQILGMIVTLGGVALVATRGDVTALLGLALNPGDLLMLLACVLYASYTLALRNRPKVSGFVFFTALAAVAFVTSLPLMFYEIWMGTVLWPTPKGWMIVLYIALFPSLIAQLFFMRAVELIGPGRAGIFVNLVPVFGAILAVGILAEPFRLYHGAALLLVFGGIWLAEWRRKF
ncbi:MAG: DMT family transporter [Limimaricola soesokkakensis]|uniref:DMT family transporter n=1 Tax=Limimaricola soesokkakensis TaxID=1343159 RepID=UPI004058E565